jgi:exodeoxyribonuclease-1
MLVNMAKTFFFYDLETSGLNPKIQRIMQFAGQRTDMQLNPVSEPVNVLVRLSDDIVPDPEAVMITGITPQKTLEEGLSEPEFAKLLSDDIFTEDTITVGFNNVRFDDDFIRHTLWRNFYDPYEWHWKDGRSRWDMLDVVRVTRALRPEGIGWPFSEDNRPVNKLEPITRVNKLNHVKAHDAMSDVEGLIEVTKLIRDKQPKLFDYLLKIRDKNEVKKLVNLDQKAPFVYASGRYPIDGHHTTVAFPLTSGSNGNVVVYDLRHDPTPFVNMPGDELKKAIFANRQARKAEDFVAVPVKELAYNKCPAVAPLGVLEQENGWKKLGLSLETIEKHKSVLLQNPQFAENVRSAFESREPYDKKGQDVESSLYDSFIPDRDKSSVAAIRNATEQELADFNPNFSDERLPVLLLRYKARNYPKTLSESEQTEWEAYRTQKLQSGLPGYAESLQRLAAVHAADDQKQFLLQELQLWAESIAPLD